MSKYFITGTGTDIGKTFVTSLLVKHLGQDNKMIGIKPIAAGVEKDDLLNNDVGTLLKSSNFFFNRWRYKFLYLSKSCITPYWR